MLLVLLAVAVKTKLPGAATFVLGTGLVRLTEAAAIAAALTPNRPASSMSLSALLRSIRLAVCFMLFPCLAAMCFP